MELFVGVWVAKDRLPRALGGAVERDIVGLALM
jgi:hypothetical protein